jgi:hypothetical protein
MTPAEAMARLDALVAAERPDNQYTTARALYSAALAGLLAVQLPPTFLYGWVLKWSTPPEARGRVNSEATA